jgi:hypothetical protein
VAHTDASLVAVTKTFSRTAQLVLNEISSHKLAGVFAKPLTERDAPGYKDLVLRPQDLKAIKTTVGRGSRAAVAVIEALEAQFEEQGVDQEDYRDEDGQGYIGNGVWQVKKTEELVPPKGISNSAQLELELVRVFANAIMFNPLPGSERGFGRNLRLRKRGGDVLTEAQKEKDKADAESSEGSTTDESESGEEGDGTETGIIKDAREMFEDVYAQVRSWRGLERDRRGEGNESAPESAKMRQDSVASAAMDDVGLATPKDKEKEKESAEEGRGTLRKRRKIAE